MSWSMAGSITTSCTTTTWGNAAGITVCRSYKAVFTFTVTGLASSIAAVWLDVIVRRRQSRFGNYGAMGSQPGMDDSGAFDVKMDDRHSESTPALNDFHDMPPAVPGSYEQGPPGYGRDEYAHAGQSHGYYDGAPGMNHRGAPGDRFGPYDQNQTGYQRPAEQTGYDPAMYR
jgi:hypothetical protein